MMLMQAPKGKSGPFNSKGGASTGSSSKAAAAPKTVSLPQASSQGCSQGGPQKSGAPEAPSTSSARKVQRPRTRHPDLAFEVSESFLKHLLFMPQ